MGNTNTAIQLYRRKIDIHGNYVHFPGYTIVSHAIHPLSKQLIDLVNYLTSSELTKYYSFLPITSYHVTINPLENVHDEHKSLLEQEQHKLKEQNTSMICTAEKFVCTKCILIEVLFKDDYNQNFETIIKNVRSNDLQEAKILYNYKQPWHLTLAYQYKDIENNEIKTKLEQIIKNIPQTLKPPFHILLDHVRICHYNDMTKFTPI
ncbi:unnamed protein product [Rotaria sp. Silwood2]|nr:unnamed protein product [Rotaria sp. Silwood2]CAF2930265.1 unnamed protein product [Rotaria sp. Silwood2]CAF3062064.1 unnamed protein product [Rotaria sp. Silwood2]CAF3863531.1 unnamed protein product [Rotaria sp. Silwood2]CAF3940985.1 unnamed protein product [Rotaria sp. Silwood2]